MSSDLPSDDEVNRYVAEAKRAFESARRLHEVGDYLISNPPKSEPRRIHPLWFLAGFCAGAIAIVAVAVIPGAFL